MEFITSTLLEIGVDVNGVITRLGGNELLYLNICKKFQNDQNFIFLKEALATDDLTSAEMHAHTLKGVAANLGFIRLEFLCKVLLDDLKNNELQFFEYNITNLAEEYYNIIGVLKGNETIQLIETPI